VQSFLEPFADSKLKYQSPSGSLFLAQGCVARKLLECFKLDLMIQCLQQPAASLSKQALPKLF